MSTYKFYILISFMCQKWKGIVLSKIMSRVTAQEKSVAVKVE